LEETEVKLDFPGAYTTFSAEDGTVRIAGGTVDVPVVVCATGDPESGGATLHPQAGDQMTFRVLKTAYATPAFQAKIVYQTKNYYVKQWFPEQDFWVLLCTGDVVQGGR
jgi:hypothetical protein